MNHLWGAAIKSLCIRIFICMYMYFNDYVINYYKISFTFPHLIPPLANSPGIIPPACLCPTLTRYLTYPPNFKQQKTLLAIRYSSAHTSHLILIFKYKGHSQGHYSNPCSFECYKAEQRVWQILLNMSNINRKGLLSNMQLLLLLAHV